MHNQVGREHQGLQRRRRQLPLALSDLIADYSYTNARSSPSGAAAQGSRARRVSSTYPTSRNWTAAAPSSSPQAHPPTTLDCTLPWCTARTEMPWKHPSRPTASATTSGVRAAGRRSPVRFALACLGSAGSTSSRCSFVSDAAPAIQRGARMRSIPLGKYCRRRPLDALLKLLYLVNPQFRCRRRC
jgi:hypothetical protein